MLLRRDLADIFDPDVQPKPQRRRRDQRYRREDRRGNDTPAPGDHEQHRDKQAELRLDGEDAEQNAGQIGRRSRLMSPPIKSAAVRKPF